MTLKRAVWILIGAAMVCALWLARPKAPGTSAPEAVRIGYLPIASDASFFVALEQGLFAKHGLTVDAEKFETSNQALEALVAGRIDATAIIALETALALEANTPSQFKIIEMTAATAQTRVHRIVVKPDSPIRSLADLRGKKVGTFPGSQMVVFLKLILGKYFNAETELEIIQLKPSLQPQALDSGQIDALFCLEPTGTQLEQKNLARVIAVNPLYEHIQKPFPTAVSVVSARLARTKPDVTQRLYHALREAHRVLRERPTDAAVALPKYAPIEPALAAKIAVYDYWDIAGIDRASVQKLADLYATRGIIPKRVDTAGLYASID